MSEPTEPRVVSLQGRLDAFDGYWQPRIVGELNGQHVKLAKLLGEFVWHQHEDADELFLVLRGVLRIELRDRALTLREGEMVIIPRGVEHRPVADEPCEVVLFWPASTLNTGNVQDGRTREDLDRI